MPFITVKETEPTVFLWQEKAGKLPCTPQEYSEDEAAGFKRAADRYIVIKEYSSSYHDDYSHGYRRIDIEPDKYVIRDGELIGFILLENRFLPLDFSDYLYHSYGGSHTLGSGTEKYFLIKSDDLDVEFPKSFFMPSDIEKKIEVLFKKRYC